MVIEYKIRFEKNGVTISQRVEPGQAGTSPPVFSSTSPSAQPISVSLPGSFGQAQQANRGKSLGGRFSTDPGGGDGAQPDPGGGDGAQTDPGGGDGAQTDPGGGKPKPGAVIVFGPTIFVGSDAGEPPGGGNGAQTDPGGGDGAQTTPGGTP